MENTQIEELANELYSLQDEYDMSNPFEIAKAVLSLGYEKMPEGSVVIDKLEYHKLKMLEKYHITCEDVNEYITNAYDQAISRFAERLKNKFEHCAGDVYSANRIDEKIDDTAKELGVNLQESAKICKNTQKKPNFENHTSDPNWN